MNWDDVRFFLAVVDAGTTAAAAKRLAMNQSTVSRRLAAFERALGLNLFDRKGSGLSLTVEGRRLLPLAQEMADAAKRIQLSFASSPESLRGTVRVATVQEIAGWLIAPAMTEFRRRFPGIELRLKTGHRILNLSTGEADISLRLMRPTEGDLIGKKVGEIRFGVWGHPSYLEKIDPGEWDRIEALDWIVLEDMPGFYSEVEHLKALLRQVKPVLRCNDNKTMLSAVRAGLGVSIIANATARLVGDLQRLPIDTKHLKRELWLVLPRRLKEVPAIQKVAAFLEELIQRPLVRSTYRD